MKTVDDVLALWPTISALAADIGEPPVNISMWKYRQSIPADYDYRIVKAAQRRGISLDFETLAHIRMGIDIDAA